VPLQAVELPPGYKAYRLVRSRKFKEALSFLDGILATEPNRADLWVNRGVALQALYRLDESAASFSRALLCRPDDVGALINRGAVRGWQGRYDEALRDLDRAVALEPDNDAARLGRGVLLSAIGQHDKALLDADHVLSINPGSGPAHYNRALVLLSLGDYEEGFREHEWRFGTNAILGRHRFRQPVWLGQKTSKRILVHCEQGLGDSIQFCRYLPMMKDLNVTIEAPKVLVRLFEQFGFPVVMRDDPLPEFDLHVPMMSLAAVFATGLNSVPYKNQYLCADRQWPGISALSGKKVGFSWTSGLRPEQPIAVAMQARKSVPAHEAVRLLSVPGVSLVSLQKDIDHNGVLPGLIDPMPSVKDMADTAAIISDLDLVITVDSAVAHLAGAMGKPVWVLNRYDICWRWLSGKTESPWYDSAKVYRQSQPCRWDDVIDAVKRDLEKL
jgi:tetratricopeptide (TPR) repeat protein